MAIPYMSVQAYILNKNLGKKGGSMQPTTEILMHPWYVWWALIIGLFLMTFIGTWIITRRWDK